MNIREDRRRALAAHTRQPQKSGAWIPVASVGALVALIAGYLIITSHQRNSARQAELDRARHEKRQMDKGIRKLLEDPAREAILLQAGEKKRARLAEFASRNVPYQTCGICSGDGWVMVKIEVSGYGKNTGRTHECPECKGGGVMEMRLCPSCGNNRTACETCGGRLFGKPR